MDTDTRVVGKTADLPARFAVVVIRGDGEREVLRAGSTIARRQYGRLRVGHRLTTTGAEASCPSLTVKMKESAPE